VNCTSTLQSRASWPLLAMAHYRPAMMLILALCCASIAEEGMGKASQSEDDLTVLMQTTLRVRKQAANKLNANQDGNVVAENAGEKDKAGEKDRAAQNASKQGAVTPLQNSVEDRNTVPENASEQGKDAQVKIITAGANTSGSMTIGAISSKSAELRSEGAQNATQNSTQNATFPGLGGIVGTVGNVVGDVVDVVADVLFDSSDVVKLVTAYEDIIALVGDFGTNMSSCITELKASPAFATKDLDAVKEALSEGLKCFDNVLFPITGDVKKCAEQTESLLETFLPDSLENVVETAEGVVTKAVDGLNKALTDAAALVESVNASETLCTVVPNALGGLDKSVGSFLDSMTSFDLIAVVHKVEGGEELLDSLINSLPSSLGGTLHDALDTVHDTADAIVTKVPAPIKELVDTINATLSSGFCSENVPEVKAAASNMPFFLPAVLLVSMLLSGSGM